MKKLLYFLGRPTLLLWLLINPLNLFAQITNPSPIHFPVPGREENMLFYLQRDPNTNTLIYALNLQKDGKIDKNQPVKIYWIRYSENKQRKELGYIQRKFAYGLITKPINQEQYELRFVSHKSLVFYLKRLGNGNYYVEIIINGKKISVQRLFVRIEGGSFWIPNVKYATIEGQDTESGKPVIEKISIK